MIIIIIANHFCHCQFKLLIYFDWQKTNKNTSDVNLLNKYKSRILDSGHNIKTILNFKYKIII